MGNVGLPAAACTPTAAECNTQIAECLPVHDNAGAPSFGLRMADLALTAPPSLTKGLVKSVIANGVTPAQPACNLNGGGTFSWLLAFDTGAGTVKTGGAKPAANPAAGYTFVDQNYPITGGMLHVTPVTLTAPLNAACSTDSSAGDVNMPVYLDFQASQVVLFPLRQARFVNLTVSGNHDCIGKYNAAGLDPAGGCLADQQTPAFFPDAQVVAMINLENADSIPIAALGQSLCVVLSGDAAIYGDGAQPTVHCKRVNGKILFQGDWCTATNQAASALCKDALYFAGAFAASGVIIN